MNGSNLLFDCEGEFDSELQVNVEMALFDPGTQLFAGPDPPRQPREGDTWIEMGSMEARIFTNGAWSEVGNVSKSP